jgi:hypothetical protein
MEKAFVKKKRFKVFALTKKSDLERKFGGEAIEKRREEKRREEKRREEKRREEKKKRRKREAKRRDEMR